MPKTLYSKFKFETIKKGPKRSRVCLYHTPHGIIETPAFIFCATKAALKGVDIEYKPQSNHQKTFQLEDHTGFKFKKYNSDIQDHHTVTEEKTTTQIILSNTYHLMVHPGMPEIIEKHGGLHNFMNWQGPMMTDSGGFQIFSLGHGSVANEIKGKGMKTNKTLTKITRKHAEFRSYVDGSKHNLSPAKSIDVQRKLGADFCFVLDECTPFHVDKKYTERSMLLSHEWEQQSLEEFIKKDLDYQSQNRHQVLYGISQGGVYKDLRKKSCEFLAENNFWGNAIGGSLGSNPEQMYEIVEYTTELMHEKTPERPIHLLGIGKISDIFEGVKNGIDTFDCVHPTRIARHGCAIIKKIDYLLGENISFLNKFLEDTVSECENLSRSNHEYDLNINEAEFKKAEIANDENTSKNESHKSINWDKLKKSDRYQELLNQTLEKEYINITNSKFKHDQGKILFNHRSEAKYTRAYIHYLFKAKEMIGVTILTRHNMYMMNKLMQEIRECIKENGDLEALKKEWI